MLSIISIHNVDGIELKQSKIRLNFTQGVQYNIFEEHQFQANVPIEWILPEGTNSQLFGLKILPKKFPLEFSSNGNDSLSAAFFSKEGVAYFFAFTQGENLSHNIIWKKNNPQNQLLEFSIWVSIPSKQMVPPGEYRCSLNLALISENQEAIAEQELVLMIEVAPCQTLEFIIDGEGEGVGKTKRLRFYETQETSTRIFQLEVVSNVAYEIQCKSMQEGKLKMTPESRRGNYGTVDMPYIMCAQGKKIDLKGNFVPLFLSPWVKSIHPFRHPIAITIHPDLRKNWEGVYEDEIIFSIRPLL